MKQKMINLLLTLAVVLLFVQAAQSQTAVQFQAQITVANGTNSQILRIGVSGDGPNPPGTIQDNTIGADTDPGFLSYLEALAPPPPPPPFEFDARIVTIPGRTSAFPTGLGGGVFADYRGYFSAAQVDSFKITIAGDATDNAPTTVSWPNNLNLYGTTWTIKPQVGSDWPTTNMLTSTSVVIPAGLQKNIIIIKTGALVPLPGPTFVLNNSSLNFGTITVGNSTTQSVSVTNTGTTNALSITGVTPVANYTVTPNPPGAYPISVAPGTSRTFDVVFTPPAAGTFAGDVVFAHNAPGGTTNLTVTGVGQLQPTQGGDLTLSSASLSRFDNTNDYPDSLQLNGYTGRGLKAVQFHMVFQGLMRLRSITRGTSVPAANFGFNYVIAHGPISPNGESNDTVKAVIYGLSQADTLPAGSYGNMMKFNYDVVNISDSVRYTSIRLKNVVGSLANGGNALLNAADTQAVTVLNRASSYRGDVNGDDRVDILDILEVVDHIIERRILTGRSFTQADVAPWPTGDNVVNVQDLSVLQNIVLTGQYPDGISITKPVVPPVIAGNGVNKLNPGVDAKVTFHLTSEGIAVRLENGRPVKGIQIEFGNVPVVPGNLAITTSLGSGFGKLVNQTLRVLLYDQAAAVLPVGDRIVANIPFGLVNPADVTLENLVVAGQDNRKLSKVESELSLEAAEELPVAFVLSQNYPNPFNPTTNIRFSVPQTSEVRISIYNVLGQEVRTLFAGQMDRGTKVVEWNGLDNRGRQLSSGTYVYRMTAGGFVQSNKMLLLK